ncbi:hypothetical protein DL96DRAFT_1826361 [Flagelloscypha sp. PMI_526]|nr:hypothetical protein DL96DRAFT_1826361 [Flagelloscypha sp. PMI_526]
MATPSNLENEPAWHLIQSIEQEREDLYELLTEEERILSRKSTLQDSIQRNVRLLTRLLPASMDTVFGMFDVMNHIFQLAVFSDPISSCIIQETALPMSMSLAAVSSRWRRTAISCPTLWGIILINTSHVSSIPQQTLRQRVALYLLRSDQSSLHLDLDISDFPDEGIQPLLQLILAHRSHLKTMRVAANTHQYHLILPFGSLPQLTTLSLRLADQRHISELSDWEVPNVTVLKAPKLRNVTIQHDMFWRFTGLPWAQLDKLYVGSQCSSIPHRLLGESSQLSKLVITSTRTVDQDHVETHIHLNQLQKLMLCDDMLMLDFSSLTTPELISLSFEAPLPESAFQFDAFQAFLLRSPHLKKLTVANRYCHSREEAILPLSHPSVTTISFVDLTEEDDVTFLFEVFDPSRLKEAFPSLISIHLDFVEIEEWSQLPNTRLGIIHAALMFVASLGPHSDLPDFNGVHLHLPSGWMKELELPNSPYLFISTDCTSFLNDLKDLWGELSSSIY